MNLAHLHLLLNHFPTVGMVIGLGLFIVSLIGKNDDLKRASLAIFFIIALVSLPAYMSGNAAQQAIEKSPGVSEDLIQTHRDAALLAFIFMATTGLIAWLGLWQFRRISRPALWTMPAVLLLSLVTFGLMARAATMGGDIRHPEIRAAGETTEGSFQIEWLKTASIASFVVGHPWVWPASETLHFIGLALLVGIVLLVNLRMLGIRKNVSFAALHQLLPLGVLGFAMNSITGMLFFIATPEQYTQNIAFHWKIALILLAGVNILYFTVFDEPWALAAGEDAPPTSKFVAASAICLWLGVIYCGRMLPFIGNSF